MSAMTAAHRLDFVLFFTTFRTSPRRPLGRPGTCLGAGSSARRNAADRLRERPRMVHRGDSGELGRGITDVEFAHYSFARHVANMEIHAGHFAIATAAAAKGI
ncbi:hypothetical protein [Phreatobacter sp. AB_2022a]|uniref:hypothetical protein n=1 Tax=Phreatobacter sp. AB_2022a TaxID=3003134 RepID=UPI002286FA34|nr:hypothetical protein [Phreatobacter sp. AB_2022a]MCZ0738381.1 hypothetical protein [Phreatobacter sp. AB_2022a]